LTKQENHNNVKDVAKESNRFVTDKASKRPIMKDVAERAGVSVTSVSYVLNGTRFVSPDKTMQEHVDGYMRALIDGGMPVNPNAIKTSPGMASIMNELQYTESYKMMEQLLQISVRVVLCGNRRLFISQGQWNPYSGGGFHHHL
jgi:DNA-binding LacI/PurR family transcriptional regulator